MEELDLSAMKRFFWEQGERRILEKQDYFVRQGERSGRVAYVEDGMFRFVRTDTKGGEHIVGYSFRDSFVAEYTSCLCSRPALADVQAIVRSTLYVLPYEKLRRYWEMSSEHQRLGRVVAEQLFVMTYRRLMDSYCCTPEERVDGVAQGVASLPRRIVIAHEKGGIEAAVQPFHHHLR